jgi:hypothetical protein
MYSSIKYRYFMRKLLSIIMVILPIAVYSQYIGYETISESNVSQWNLKSINEYRGVYHFGESDMESELRLIIDNGLICAQIKKGYWKNSSEWVWVYENLKNVKIIGNKFYSNKTDGEFVMYKKSPKLLYGLKVYISWSGITEPQFYEIGYRNSTLEDVYDGKYAFASLKKVNEKWLRAFSKADLKIIRNEIYARYGYIFTAGSDMDKYFKKTKWYFPKYADIDSFLTDIELLNIKIIKASEEN